MTLSSLDSNGSPFKVTVPFKLPFAIRLANASMRVDFPDPLAPSTASISPSRASPEMSFSSTFVFVSKFSPATGSDAVADASRRLFRWNTAGNVIFRRIFTLSIPL
ncbi:hypothetical protein F0562_026085 [Nyssa sinensis]|uniref:Uncharacterized protein n=1 Tax=Nyssa sinensis TaxID=561372 RepID=A0A5J5B827_9ASTE|nr:hypothetical protein F0562_026085 [Nyssa sinensis]